MVTDIKIEMLPFCACLQEQCPCVSNACQITADVMEDIRPFCLMVEECRELYAILTTPHIRVRATAQAIWAGKSWQKILEGLCVVMMSL